MFKRKFTTQQIVLVGMLSALAGVLMSLEISVPLMPPFYKFDFSSVPAIIGLFLMGPIEGALIEIIKLIIKLILSGTNSMYVGELVNLFAIFLFIIPTWSIYKRLGETKKAVVIALAVCVFIRTASACFLNAYIALPMYATALGISLDDVIKAVSGVNTHIIDLKSFIIYATIPFNILKLTINSFIGYVLYDRLIVIVPTCRNLRSVSLDTEKGLA